MGIHLTSCNTLFSSSNLKVHILGDEDHLGDMDFKVTGTKEGITACQMDIKIKGLKYEILVEALHQAKKGRLEILDKLDESINKPNETVKAHAPKMVTMEIPKDFIGAVIGPGGKMIQLLQKESETTIVINEKDELGMVEILGIDQEKRKKKRGGRRRERKKRKKKEEKRR